jgi:hypothetical protein
MLFFRKEELLKASWRALLPQIRGSPESKRNRIMSRTEELKAKLRGDNNYDRAYGDFIFRLNKYLETEKSAYVYRNKWTDDLFLRCRDIESSHLESWFHVELRELFLSANQKPNWTFFRVFVFKKSALVLSNDYREVVAFRKLNFSETVPSRGILFGEANNTPNWIAEDEAPRKFNGSKSGISFLFQTKRDYEFGVVSGAPKQKEKNFEVEGGVTDKIGDGYSLFVENELYFFGLSERDRRYIYIVPQS